MITFIQQKEMAYFPVVMVGVAFTTGDTPNILVFHIYMYHPTITSDLQSTNQFIIRLQEYPMPPSLSLFMYDFARYFGMLTTIPTLPTDLWLVATYKEIKQTIKTRYMTQWWK